MNYLIKRNILLLLSLLCLSLLVNGYFIYDEIKAKQTEEFLNVMNKSMGGSLESTPWKEGVDLFTSRLKQVDSSLLYKKYYYINIWTSWCKPCIKEMPWLDSIAGTSRKDVGYIFLSEMYQSVADSCIKRKKYHINNFVFLNEMNDFVSAVCQKKGVKNKTYPMVLIMNNKDKILYYSIGAYSNQIEARDFADLITKLK